VKYHGKENHVCAGGDFRQTGNQAEMKSVMAEQKGRVEGFWKKYPDGFAKTLHLLRCFKNQIISTDSGTPKCLNFLTQRT